MTPKLTTLFFDFDGVVADSLAMATKRYNKVLQHLGKDQVVTVDRVRRAWTGDWQKLNVEEFGLTLAELDSSADFFLSLTGPEYAPEVFPGMADVLRKLAERYKLIIVSGGGQRDIEEVLDRAKLRELFADIYCHERFNGFRKPDPRAFGLPLREHKLKSSEVYSVGDSIDDVALARSAGVPAASCTWGWNTREALVAAKPDRIVDKPEELLFLLEQ